MDLAEVAEAMGACPRWLLLICADPEREAAGARQYFADLGRKTRLLHAPRSLRRLGRAKDGEVALVVLSGNAPPVTAAELEAQRSRMADALPAAAFFAAEADARLIASAAPNFASFLRGGIVHLAANIGTPDFRTGRLEELRTAWQLTDGEVVARAEAGALAPEPDFAVWLVLLNRSDLLAQFHNRPVQV